MKVTVDVDCTPEEARRFLGLPDLSAVHEAYVEKMKAAVTEGPSPEMFGDMMKAWGPMNEAGMKMWKQMLDQMGGKARDADATRSSLCPRARRRPRSRWSGSAGPGPMPRWRRWPGGCRSRAWRPSGSLRVGWRSP